MIQNGCACYSDMEEKIRLCKIEFIASLLSDHSVFKLATFDIRTGFVDGVVIAQFSSSASFIAAI